ncbi:MAG: metal ABC transporter substrate-binding protein [Patescibacteria group bacterium]|jgi:zinc transport system substrate-binding protein
MNKKAALFLIIVFLLAGGVIYFKQRGSNSVNNSQTQKVVVAATIFPLSDITRQIGGDLIEVKNILPSGASPHTFELRPSDIAGLRSAKIIFAIGNNLDSWVDEAVQNSSQARLVSVDQGVQLKNFPPLDASLESSEAGGIDPHYWLSIINARLIARTITDNLIALQPENADEFNNNLKQYQGELDSLETEMKGLLSDKRIGDLIVFHESWAYFADEFGLTIAGVFEPRPGQEPTPKYLQALYKSAKDHNVKVVFTEPQLASDLINPFVQDLGLSISTLDPLGGSGQRDSYINMMRYNAREIHNAFIK